MENNIFLLMTSLLIINNYRTSEKYILQYDENIEFIEQLMLYWYFVLAALNINAIWKHNIDEESPWKLLFLC